MQNKRTKIINTHQFGECFCIRIEVQDRRGYLITCPFYSNKEYEMGWAKLLSFR